ARRDRPDAAARCRKPRSAWLGIGPRMITRRRVASPFLIRPDPQLNSHRWRRHAMETTLRTQAPRSRGTTEVNSVAEAPLSPDLLHRMDAYWRAANYLSVGQIYLYDNPLLREPLKLEHVKPRLLGHWGTTPGQNFVYVHLNRVINQHDMNMIYIS